MRDVFRGRGWLTEHFRVSSSLQDVTHVVLGSSSLKITLRWELSDEQR